LTVLTPENNYICRCVIFSGKNPESKIYILKGIIHRLLLCVLLFAVLVSEQAAAQDSVQVITGKRRKFIPDPTKATMLAAAFPGLGQIYNRKYWKVPFVYAGFGGVGYAVYYNTKWYNTYIKAYQDFTDEIPETDSYIKLIRNIKPEEYDPVLHPSTYNLSTASWIKDQMMRQIDYFKKYRDLSYIGIAAWYLFTILDASVDASLFDYDISESLALKIEPVKIPLYNFVGAGINVKLLVTF